MSAIYVKVIAPPPPPDLPTDWRLKPRLDKENPGPEPLSGKSMSRHPASSISESERERGQEREGEQGGEGGYYEGPQVKERERERGRRYWVASNVTLVWGILCSGGRPHHNSNVVTMRCLWHPPHLQNDHPIFRLEPCLTSEPVLHVWVVIVGDLLVF